MAALMHELTPPPQRSPMRFAAAAMIGLVLVGGATAAVVTRPSPSGPTPYVDDTLGKLVSEINKRDAEIKELRRQLTDGQVKHVQEIEQLKTRLDQKQQEVQQLVDQVAQLRVQQAQGRVPPRPPQDPQIIAAVQGAQGNVEGCFMEWDDRALAFGSAKTLLFTDADLVVEFSVAPDGHAYNQKARGVDSPSLTLCVADALARIQYPHGPDHSDLQVQVAWAAGNVKMSGRIVSHRAPSSSTLEGI
jgi:hypothetical protein